jgi:hypothetical protein
MMVSVILCTHNPRPAYLQRCLDGLRQQTLPRDRWELVVVDNCSDQPVAYHPHVSWHPFARLLREETLGLTSARLRGIREAKGDLLVFVDDDNVLDADFLETALRIAEERPFLGAWSGQCRPEFDRVPPQWTRRYWGSLCIREFNNDVWSNLPRLAHTMPAGAGLCVRRAVAGRYVQLHDNGKRSIVLDRAGDSLLSGGDNDLAACACDIGLGVGLFTALKLTHIIPPQRLSEDYLCRLIEGIEYSSCILDAERGLAVPTRGLAGRIADQLRLLRLRGPHRRIMQAVFRGRAAAQRLIASKSSTRSANTLR